MLTVFASEQRPNSTRPARIKITSDKDCLPPDAFRVCERVFPDYDSILETAEMYHCRGFEVCVDIEGYAMAEYEV